MSPLHPVRLPGSRLLLLAITGALVSSTVPQHAQAEEIHSSIPTAETPVRSAPPAPSSLPTPAPSSPPPPAPSSTPNPAPTPDEAPKLNSADAAAPAAQTPPEASIELPVERTPPEAVPEPPPGQIPATAEPRPGSVAAPESTAQLEVGPGEPQAKAKAAQANTPPPIYEPPLPGALAPNDEVPAVSPLGAKPRRSPRTALWVGARGGWLSPQGSLWLDGAPAGDACCVFERRLFSDFASSAPKVQIDLGGRFARHYNIFATWEYSAVGPGELLKNEMGGQKRGSLTYLGGGMRFSSDPDDFGFLFEVNLGYRRFIANWKDGTRLDTEDDYLTMRIALGADIRVSDDLAISPQFAFSGGAFSDVRWKYADGTNESALSVFDDLGQHRTLSFEVGAHYDFIHFR